ncbi:hypothetical protein FSB65_31795 [Paraburkholderia sp. JPY418]|nr:hypothetical protein [Paraburkholderia youngii]
MKKKTFAPSLRATTLCSVLAAHVALANPVVCSPGYWDATCNGRINAGYQTPPTCSSGPGYTTVSAAQWIGSKYSDPVCNYQAPPSCAPGWIQSGPDWNGSSWVNLGCTAPSPPPKTIVSATGFWVWADCGSYLGGSKTGPIPLAVYQNNWSDGSTTYYQFFFGKQYPVSVDSQGRYYVNELGDNWDTDQGNGYPLASLYETAAGDPSASIPPQPAYACSGSNH